MDILRVLSAPDLEVRKKTLSLALDLVTSRNIEEVSKLPFTNNSTFW
jgi:coatomer subunit beta